MKFVPAAATRAIGRTVLKTQKASPTLLFGAGIVGFGATVFLASRATLRLEEVLTESQEHIEVAQNLIGQGATPAHKAYSLEDFAEDRRLIYAKTTIHICKLYAPAVVAGVFSVTCLTGSHKILSSRNAALTAAYVAIEQGFNRYRDRVREELGDDADKRFRHGSVSVDLAEDTAKGPKVVHVDRVDPDADGKIYARFFDQLNPNWETTPEANLNFLAMHQKWANQRLHAKGHLFLNDVYRSLGMEDTRAGSVCGWLADGPGDGFVDFGVFDRTDQRKIDFVNGREGAILLDFNVDGLIFDKI